MRETDVVGARLRRLAWLATVAAVAVAVALPAAASADAAEAVVDFEDAPIGTQITTRYLHTGGMMQGVTFGEFTTGSAGELPRVEEAGDQAASGTRVASIYDDNVEFPDARVYGRFRYAKHFVRVSVGIAPGGSPRSIGLTGYDAAGVPIPGAQAQKLVFAGGGYKTKLEIHSDAGQIAYFRVAPTDAGAAPVLKIDDLAFDVPDAGAPPPPPDFGLSLDQNSVMGEDVGVRRGESTTARIVVGRVNGASGPLEFSVSGLPTGVSARFVPEKETAAPSVGLELTAGDQAQAVSDRPITVTADPNGNAQAGQAPRSMTFDLDVFRTYDLRVTGIEVTQGIQAQHTPCASNAQCAVVPSLPRLSTANPAAPVPYQGVRLVRSKKTVARVFASTTQPAGVDEVGVVLRGFRDGKELPGSPLVRERDLAFGPFPHVTWTERTHPKGGEAFVLPPSWTAGSVTLQAELREPLRFLGHGAAECVEAGCQANNRLRMTGIPFVSTGYIDLATVRMWYRGEVARCAAEEPNESAARRCPAPWKVLEKPSRLLPLQENGYNFDPVSYYGSVEITDLKQEYSGEDRSREAKYRLDDYADDQPQGCSSRRFCADQLFGVYGPKYSTGGHSRGRLVTPTPGGGYLIDQPFAVASWKTAQTHELSHGLGRAHADTACGGDSDGETGEEWPPDNRGTMDGVGYDVRNGDVIAPRALGAFGSSDPKAPDYQPARWYDYMSYCGHDDADSGAWTSVRGWEKNIDLLRQIADALGRDGADAPRAASAAQASAARAAAPRAISAAAPQEPATAHAASASVLRVRAAVVGHGASARITSVKPRTGDPRGGPVDAGYAIVARDAAGRVRSQTSPQVSHEHGHPGEHTETIVADIPAAGVERVELVGAGGTVLATRSASAHAARVRVLAPHRAQRVGGRDGVLVRWRASDPDGDRLVVKVDYSGDDGRSWRLIHIGRGGSSVRLPGGLLAASRHARIRVRANDGFHETAARSQRFRSLGHKPHVRITSPGGRTDVGADQAVYLAGDAYDDQHLRLTGRRLQWFDGRRRLATGPAVSAAGLRPGRHVIRLVARDRLGRRASASVRLRVRAVKPAILSLAAPEAVRPGARRLRLRIASSVAARLDVRGHGVRSVPAQVSPHARSVSVRVRPGSEPLRLTLALRAGRGLTRVPLAIPRG